MRANPGGQLEPGEVIGRDGLIEELWSRLAQQSVLLCSERRMGKTCVVKKMQSEAPEGTLAVYRDIEDLRTPIQFVETVFDDVEGYLSTLGKTALKARRLVAELAGLEIKDVVKFPKVPGLHWKAILGKTVEDLVEHQAGPVVLFWDEMPLMLHNIARQHDDHAIEILDVLRALRQTHSDLRMVFTGSIGLHHVIASLRGATSPSSPVNDMYTVDLPPLSPARATELALVLLEGEGMATADLEATASAIAAAADNVPYFVQHIVAQMAGRRGHVEPGTAEEIVTQCVRDPVDSWDLSHYRERLNVYYAGNELPFALGFLDALAAADESLTFDALFNRLKSVVETSDAETARRVLTLLQRDHYLVQDTDGRFRFRFRLIQRWWRMHRGLGS